MNIVYVKIAENENEIAKNKIQYFFKNLLNIITVKELRGKPNIYFTPKK